eukprot:scaffold16119_cov83-Skeletonema_marinoi.AAC.8
MAPLQRSAPLRQQQRCQVCNQPMRKLQTREVDVDENSEHKRTGKHLHARYGNYAIQLIRILPSKPFQRQQGLVRRLVGIGGGGRCPLSQLLMKMFGSTY